MERTKTHQSKNRKLKEKRGNRKRAKKTGNRKSTKKITEMGNPPKKEEKKKRGVTGSHPRPTNQEPKNAPIEK